MLEDESPGMITQLHRSGEIRFFRQQRLTNFHGNFATAWKPLAVAQNGPRAADCDRHDRHRRLGCDSERPQVKR